MSGLLDLSEELVAKVLLLAVRRAESASRVCAASNLALLALLGASARTRGALLGSLADAGPVSLAFAHAAPRVLVERAYRVLRGAQAGTCVFVWNRAAAGLGPALAARLPHIEFALPCADFERVRPFDRAPPADAASPRGTDIFRATARGAIVDAARRVAVRVRPRPAALAARRRAPLVRQWFDALEAERQGFAPLTVHTCERRAVFPDGAWGARALRHVAHLTVEVEGRQPFAAPPPRVAESAQCLIAACPALRVVNVEALHAAHQCEFAMAAADMARVVVDNEGVVMCGPYTRIEHVRGRAVVRLALALDFANPPMLLTTRAFLNEAIALFCARRPGAAPVAEQLVLRVDVDAVYRPDAPFFAETAAAVLGGAYALLQAAGPAVRSLVLDAPGHACLQGAVADAYTLRLLSLLRGALPAAALHGLRALDASATALAACAAALAAADAPRSIDTLRVVCPRDCSLAAIRSSDAFAGVRVLEARLHEASPAMLAQLRAAAEGLPALHELSVVAPAGCCADAVARSLAGLRDGAVAVRVATVLAAVDSPASLTPV